MLKSLRVLIGYLNSLVYNTVMSLKLKRIILIVTIVILTGVCYLIMNRNYDPLSRYPYDDTQARQAILEYMDDREIQYIVDYSISPSEFMDYIESPNFNVFYTAYYNEARQSLYYLTNYQIVDVVNKIMSKRLDFDECMKKYAYWQYYGILGDLN